MQILNHSDMLLEECVVIDNKAIENMLPVHQAQ
jgi:hypothetical protein